MICGSCRQAADALHLGLTVETLTSADLIRLVKLRAGHQ
jgi:hypothetical protein